MKKSIVILVALMGLVATAVYAGNQYNWGTSTGGSWITPDDTALTPNTFLVITSTQYPAVTTTGQPWLQSRTLAQITASTPTAVGQIVFCSNCVASKICISTGTAGSNDGGFNQFLIVGSSSPSLGVNNIVTCR